MSMDLLPEFRSNAGIYGYTDSCRGDASKASSGTTAIGKYLGTMQRGSCCPLSSANAIDRLI